MKIEIGGEYAVKRDLPDSFLNYEFEVGRTPANFPLYESIIVGRIFEQVTREDYIVRIVANRKVSGVFDEFAVNARELTTVEDMIDKVRNKPKVKKEELDIALEEENDDDPI